MSRFQSTSEADLLPPDELTCEAQHTLFQPGAPWHCPVCSNHVYTNKPAPKANPRCGQLHTKEQVRCIGCGRKWQGWEYADDLSS